MTPHRPVAAIFRTVYPNPSEPFIVEQAGAMKRYRPLFVLRTRTGRIGYPAVAISDHDPTGLCQALYAATRVPLWRDLPDVSIVHAHFGTDGVYALPLARKARVPLVVSYHGFDANCTTAAFLKSLKPSSYLFLLLEKSLMKKADCVLAPSEFLRRRLIAKGFHPDKVITHYVGTDTTRFIPVEDRAGGYILSVGRHAEEKGLDTLLQAFAKVARRYPRLRLLQVGTGSMTGILRRLSADLGVEGRVDFIGSRSRDDIVRLMQHAEVVALTSCRGSSGGEESFGLALIEAAACGTPVVGTVCGGIPEAVRDGETGFLVPPRNPVAVATAMTTLLDDRELRERMGRRGRELACRSFSLAERTAVLEKVYDTVRR